MYGNFCLILIYFIHLSYLKEISRLKIKALKTCIISNLLIPCEEYRSTNTHHIKNPFKYRVCLHSETNNCIGTKSSSFLLEFIQQFISDVAGQLGEALDLTSNQTLEARTDVTEHVPALDLAGHHQPLVLDGGGHAGLIGSVHLNCFNVSLGCHDSVVS